MGETVVTAADLARIYQHVLHDMAAEDRQLIVGALQSARQTAVDGFDQFFGLLVNGASEQVYAKQGWMTYLPATTYLHSAGVVHDDRTATDYAVILLSEQTSVSTRIARTQLSTVATAALAALS